MTMSVPNPPVPLRERVNFRLLGFVAIFALLIGWPLYTAVDFAISGGVKNRGDFFEVDLKAMSSFPFDQKDGRIDDVPQTWRDLNGKTVLMEGEIAPGGLSADGINDRFDLVYSVAKCCFSGPPQVQHFVKVSIPREASIHVSRDGAIRVKGTLKVDVTHDPETGAINGVYHVVAQDVASL